ncbi:MULTISPECIES: type II toxin-antitoxin system HicA family toxin [unclassified Tatumella]|uniref:type II toxin-antitoxin system HicA family toxin n=1 Tax=unclassified Tatumella TaxID=2649542 RepID=UPI001BAF15D0|nr:MULTISPECIES: type II toxin-antitoxin system HicA family toxin [unclassified Tatumella]MBS0854942.1 type II toxin-antitoxin system HicA family toxin [Tatumella sp. JGM16]MBS0912096.1 type II toxin-antitoxin system HicA family toxin [Tatumella sp. JGM91]
MFGRKLSPLKYTEVVKGLQILGFEMKVKTGTSHEQWIRKTESTKHVVTVDKHHAPFSRDLIKSMAKQAGIDSRKFHSLCRGECSIEDIGLYPAE